MAMSLTVPGDREGEIHWDTPLQHGPGLVRSLLDTEWNPGVLMNINFPDRAPGDVAGVRVTVQGKRDQNTLFIDERFDTWGAPYYWFNFERRRSNPFQGSDLWAIYNGFISLTPLAPNLTYLPAIDSLSRAFDSE